MKSWTQTQVGRPDINSICSQFVGLSDIIKVVAWVFDVYLYFLYTCKISMKKSIFIFFYLQFFRSLQQTAESFIPARRPPVTR